VVELEEDATDYSGAGEGTELCLLIEGYEDAVVPAERFAKEDLGGDAIDRLGDVGLDFFAAADDSADTVFPFLSVLDGAAGGVTDLIAGLVAVDIVIAFDHHLLGVIEEADVVDLAFHPIFGS